MSARELEDYDMKGLWAVNRRHAAGSDNTNREWDAALDRAQNDGGFHWRNATYFKRMPDGSVRLRIFHPTQLQPDTWTWTARTIDPASWASIVCSVSADGETGERWEAAQDFHGRNRP